MSLLLVLFSLTPITNPVAMDLETEYRLIHGLVPFQEWTSVPGLPFCSSTTFSEVTFHSGSSKCFRALSSGPTAGMHPSIGSYVNGNGYAGFLLVEGLQMKVCDFSTGLNTGVSFRGVTAESRNTEADDPDFFAEYSSEHLLLATGETSFTGGIFLNPAENVLLGPAWCQDRETARFWISSDIEFGPLRLQSGGAVTDSTFSRRANVILNSGVAEITAGMDEEELFVITRRDCGFADLSVCMPDWGFHLLFDRSNQYLFSLSHREGGELQGEFQFSYRGLLAGLTAERENGGKWTSGFIAGLAFP